MKSAIRNPQSAILHVLAGVEMVAARRAGVTSCGRRYELSLAGCDVRVTLNGGSADTDAPRLHRVLAGLLEMPPGAMK
jgi:hypothetical protein